MRLRWMLFTVPLLAAAPAVASMTGGSTPAPPAPPPANPTPGMSTTSTDADASSQRQKAERAYAEAYDQIAKAKQDLEAGKGKNAEKKFRKALESAQEAVALDDKYAEAWNAVGYSSRKLGKYDDALKAYGRALDLKPDYAAAREYLGEAYLELGQLDKAKDQLVMLDHQNAADESKQLKTAIDAYQAAHPDSSTAKSGSGQ